jgi:hypothetical protein
MNERLKELLIQSEVFNKDGTVLKDVTKYELNKFAELVRQDEREACAKLCETWSASFDDGVFFATVIREGGEK